MIFIWCKYKWFFPILIILNYIWPKWLNMEILRDLCTLSVIHPSLSGFLECPTVRAGPAGLAPPPLGILYILVCLCTSWMYLDIFLVYFRTIGHSRKPPSSNVLELRSWSKTIPRPRFKTTLSPHHSLAVSALNKKKKFSGSELSHDWVRARTYTCWRISDMLTQEKRKL